MISELFDSDQWESVSAFNFKDITYHRAKSQGTVRIAFNRPEVRNGERELADRIIGHVTHAEQQAIFFDV